jgi:hypothetical protein
MNYLPQYLQRAPTDFAKISVVVRHECLPSLAPLTLTHAHPKLLSASRKQQSQTNVVFVPMGLS